MPTRPRAGTGRPQKKTVPPTVPQPPAVESTASERTEVTATHLERHEIPSFSESREARIAEAACWRAERRGFVPGQELDDWLDAEREVDSNGARPQPHRERG